MLCCGIFFFNDTATTEIYTLSLHDALPISVRLERVVDHGEVARLEDVQRHLASRQQQRAGEREYRQDVRTILRPAVDRIDRKSTRLNSSHANISYAVFCLKKKHNIKNATTH